MTRAKKKALAKLKREELNKQKQEAQQSAITETIKEEPVIVEEIPVEKEEEISEPLEEKEMHATNEEILPLYRISNKTFNRLSDEAKTNYVAAAKYVFPTIKASNFYNLLGIKNTYAAALEKYGLENNTNKMHKFNRLYLEQIVANPKYAIGSGYPIPPYIGKPEINTNEIEFINKSLQDAEDFRIKKVDIDIFDKWSDTDKTAYLNVFLEKYNMAVNADFINFMGGHETTIRANLEKIGFKNPNMNDPTKKRYESVYADEQFKEIETITSDKLSDAIAIKERKGKWHSIYIPEFIFEPKKGPTFAELEKLYSGYGAVPKVEPIEEPVEETVEEHIIEPVETFSEPEEKKPQASITTSKAKKSLLEMMKTMTLEGSIEDICNILLEEKFSGKIKVHIEKI